MTKRPMTSMKDAAWAAGYVTGAIVFSGLTAEAYDAAQRSTGFIQGVAGAAMALFAMVGFAAAMMALQHAINFFIPGWFPPPKRPPDPEGKR